MAVKFTQDQQRVIDTRNSNILVSAAAGSGKTAVLVERIIQMITDDKNPVDIDRLLIVTFTSAAAAQMRERISKAVSKKLEENPENEHLQKQATLIHNAQITTIDSFCLFIIRNNFNEIGLDPGFRVADESEIKLLERDVMDKLLEDEHAKADENFIKFVESYSTGASEKRIEAAILRLYHFSISYPFPEEWLEKRYEDYKIDDISLLYQKKWFSEALDYMDTVLAECENRLNKCLEIAGVTGGPIQYTENIVSDLELIQELRSTRDYVRLYDLFTYSSFTRLSAKKAEGVDPLLKEVVKGIREEVKKNVADLKKLLFQLSPENTFEDMLSCHSLVCELVRLTLEFKKRLDQSKREKNLIDFSDMEHFALDILLTRDEEGNIVPRNTALELQDYFKEIMIDEYQDSNEVQELLLRSISGEDKGNFNRFMVGDVKQSIYKFRLARPEIFMEKYDTYSTAVSEDNKKTRIDLSMNFRSRKEVTEATNFICGQIMKKQVGNVEYDEKAALYVGASYPEPSEMYDKNLYQTELLLCTEQNEDSEYTSKEQEALMVAKRIKELVGSFPIADGAEGETRPAKFSDIVILFRATTGWDEDFRRILTMNGIPVHVTSKAGYFETPEIQGIVNFLRVLDNPLQDVPLFGALKLPFFDFTEEEIVHISCFAKEQKPEEKLFLYEQLRLYASDCEQKQVSEQKLDKFFETIDRYRKMVAYTPIKELIQDIFHYMGYMAYVGAMPGGDQRQANLELLLEKAGTFQKTSFYGLFHFIRYLETINEQEVDFGEANILDENADVVRIMTVHKSKGLEFPICFVCGLSKKFNQMDVRESILMDVELGVGVDYIDPVLRIKRKTLRKNIVAQRMKEDTRGEDLRVLYVALTRAKEKLILTGHIADIDKKMNANAHLMMESEEKLPYSVMMTAGSYMDMIIAALIRHKCMKELLEERGIEFEKHDLPYVNVPIKVDIFDSDSLDIAQLKEQGQSAVLEEKLDNAQDYADDELSQKLNEKMSFEYPYSYLEGLTVKTSVSELKRAAYEEATEAVAELVMPEKESYIPDFVTVESEVTGDEAQDIYSTNLTRAIQGTQYGTAVHKIMELLSFSQDLMYEMNDENSDKRLYAAICREWEGWIKDRFIAKEDIQCVSKSRITEFFKTSLSKRMINANIRNELYREQPFVLGLSANEFNKNQDKNEMLDKETVLVQGVIDVFFYDEDNEIVLVDYKTDKVSMESELIERYKAQMDYYKMALERITGTKVKECYLYSFSLKKEILV